MKTEFVYLAHPIDFGIGRPTDYLDHVASPLQDYNLGAYVPSYAFKFPVPAQVSPVVGRINRRALTECAALIAFLPRVGETSIGVPMEIEQARSEGKPIHLVGDRHQFLSSWALPLDEPFVRATETFGIPEARQLRAMINSRAKGPRPEPSESMYVRLDPGASLPTRAYKGDAGYDLYALEETEIPPHEFVDVPMGCSVQLPDRIWAMITGRSSTVRKLDLLVTTGVIDSGYRGPLFAGVRSLRNDTYTVKKGERIAQLIPFPNVAEFLRAVPVDVLAPSDRGESGFGSSGA